MAEPDSDGVERRGTDLDPRYSAVVIHGGVAYLTGQTSYAYADTRYPRPEEFVHVQQRAKCFDLWVQRFARGYLGLISLI